MKEFFGKLPDGQEASLYTISAGQIKAVVSDLGATLVRLYVPDAKGNVADVTLGFDDVDSYLTCDGFLGAGFARIQNNNFLQRNAER